MDAAVNFVLNPDVTFYAEIKISSESGGGTDDHSMLTNRDLDNQHPISAITGLSDSLSSLDGKVDTEKDRAERIEGGLDSRISSIESKIPSEASSQNKLADIDYVNTELATKQDTISDLNAIRSGAALGATAVQPAGLDTALSSKQDTLVSGTNIKTINNTSLLGSGNLEISPGDVLPSQEGNAGKVLSTDGEDPLWIVSPDNGVNGLEYNLNGDYMLFLTKDGVRVGNGVIITGGGGPTDTFTLTTEQSLTAVVALGVPFDITYNYTSNVGASASVIILG